MLQTRNRLLPALITVLAVLTAPEVLLATQGRGVTADSMGRMLERLRFTTADIQATMSEEEICAMLTSRVEQLQQQPEHHPAHGKAYAARSERHKDITVPAAALTTPYVTSYTKPVLHSARRIRAPAA